MPLFRSLAKNLTLSLVSLFVCLGALEVGFRVVEGDRDGVGDAAPVARVDSVRGAATSRRVTPRYVPSDALGWHLQPDTVQVFRLAGRFATTVRSNSLGLRGGALAPRRGSARRLVLLGDSYGFGWGVEEAETYAARLEEILAASGGGDIQVLNAAIPGFGTFQRQRALELVLPYGIDGVIA